MKKNILVFTIIIFVFLLVAILLPKNDWRDPKGNFMEFKIEQLDVNGDVNYVWFECPADKLKEIEVGYRNSMKNVLLTSKKQMWRTNRLTIKTDNETVVVFIIWTKEYVLFEDGLESKEFRQVLGSIGFKDAGENITPPELVN